MHKKFIFNKYLIIVFVGFFIFTISITLVFESKFKKQNKLPDFASIQNTIKNENKLANYKRITSLLFVGDIMLDRGVAHVSNKNNDPLFPFLKSATFLKSADITIGNLEGSISDRGKKVGSIYSFRFAPKMLEGILYAGFDVFSLANNHIFDYGSEAFLDTIKRLSDVGIYGVGVGSNFDEANKPNIKEVNGQKFAFLSYTTLYPKSLMAHDSRAGTSNVYASTTLNLIKSLKKENIFVTILLHWGDEYEKVPNVSQKKLAKQLSGAGADLIIGHHPHVVQGVEKINNTWVAWSLGNFVFDQSFSKDTMNSLALVFYVEGGRVTQVLSVPVVINNKFQPEFKIIDLKEL